MAHRIAGVALAPLLFLQGRSVRRSILLLPEPPGDRAGQQGSGPALHLLILGDSAAAGVGVDSLQDALAGQLPRQLQDRHWVHWRLVAKTGATTASTLKHLLARPPERFDVCLTSLGVNDVTSGMRLGAWLAQQRDLRQALRTRWGVRRLIVSGLPPMHGFPALPQPLRWWLGARATAFDQALQQDIQRESDVAYLSLRFSEDLSLMARDGFHPGPAVYQEWAIKAAELISGHSPSSHAGAPKCRPG